MAWIHEPTRIPAPRERARPARSWMRHKGGLFLFARQCGLFTCRASAVEYAGVNGLHTTEVSRSKLPVSVAPVVRATASGVRKIDLIRTWDWWNCGYPIQDR